MNLGKPAAEASRRCRDGRWSGHPLNTVAPPPFLATSGASASESPSRLGVGFGHVLLLVLATRDREDSSPRLCTCQTRCQCGPGRRLGAVTTGHTPGPVGSCQCTGPGVRHSTTVFAIVNCVLEPTQLARARVWRVRPAAAHPGPGPPAVTRRRNHRSSRPDPRVDRSEQ